MFRFILSFFFKQFNKKIKNKTRSSIFAPLKFSLKFIGGFVLLCTLVVVCVDVISGVNPNAGDKVTIKRVKSKNKEGLYENNPNGTANGLNLMLLHNLKTEGWVKELLNLYLDAEEGRVSDSKYTLPLYGYMGIQLNESNALAGFLPKTYLPIKNGNFVWKESWKGIPADQVTIKNFTSENGILVANTFEEIPYLGASGYYGLFQNQVTSYESKSVINPDSQDSSRQSSIFYMPDCIAYINDRVSDFVNGTYLKYTGEVDKDVLAVIAASIHNAGQTGAAFPLTWGSYPNDSLAVSMVWSPYSDVVYNAYKELTNDFKSSYEKNKKAGSQIYYPDTSRIVGAYFLCEAGWLLDKTGNHYIHNASGVTDLIASYLLGEGKTSSDLLSYFDSKTKALPVSDSDAIRLYNWDSASESFISYHKGGIYKYTPTETQELPTGVTAPKLRVTNLESVGQMYMALIGAKVYYATSLKFVGVDVDPTDPNTYLESIPSGEWKPSGDTAWMSQYGINPSEIGPKRTAVLNEGYKWLGSLYTQYNGNADGSQKPPEKDSNGNWIDNPYENGFDCSGFMQYIFRTALGIDITRTTYSQYPNVDNMEFIDESEAKPGDLIYYFYPNDLSTEHVSMYLGKDSTTGLDIIMHAPYFGERLKITTWNGYPGTRRVFKRVKGID